MRTMKSTDFSFERGPGEKFSKQVRFEDMSPTGRLEVLIQPDGDVIVSIVQDDLQMAQAEFTTPMSGGGQSERTWKALREIYKAMQEDNRERAQTRDFSEVDRSLGVSTAREQAPEE